MDNAVISELRAADARLQASIDEVRRQGEQHAARIGKAEENIAMLNEFVSELRDSIATKDDIAALRADLRDRLDRDELLAERLDHYRQRIVDLEKEKDEQMTKSDRRFNRRMSWAMAALFVGEVVIGWLGLRHG